MYRLTANPDVIFNTETGDTIPRGHRWWDDYQAWLDDGNEPAPIPASYAPYTAAHFKAIREAAWAWMTAEVQARRYDTVESCCSYYNSNVPRYRDEARAMVAWRDDVNLALEQLVSTLPAGIETWEQVRALLPQPEQYPWPAEVDLPMTVEAGAQLL